MDFVRGLVVRALAGRVKGGFFAVLEADGEKHAALEALGERFNPGEPESLEKEIAATWNSVCVLELEIEHLTGKEAKELRNRGAGQ